MLATQGQGMSTLSKVFIAQGHSWMIFTADSHLDTHAYIFVLYIHSRRSHADTCVVIFTVRALVILWSSCRWYLTPLLSRLDGSSDHALDRLMGLDC